MIIIYVKLLQKLFMFRELKLVWRIWYNFSLDCTLYSAEGFYCGGQSWYIYTYIYIIYIYICIWDIYIYLYISLFVRKFVTKYPNLFYDVLHLFLFKLKNVNFIFKKNQNQIEKSPDQIKKKFRLNQKKSRPNQTKSR